MGIAFFAGVLVGAGLYGLVLLLALAYCLRVEERRRVTYRRAPSVSA